jgi:hypothetical protein
MPGLFKKLLLAFCVVAVLAGLILVFVPWRNMAGSKLQAALEANGLQDVHLTVSALGPHGASIENMDFRAGKTKVHIAQIRLDMKGSNLRQGDWQLHGVHIDTDGAVELPDLEGTGTVDLKQGGTSVAGQIKDHADAYHADFSLAEPFAELKLTSAVIPWQGGTVAVHNALVPLSGKKAADFTLEVKKVSFGALMQALAGEKVAATGTVSGTLPVTIKTDGTVSFGHGELRALSPGTITMPPDTIPGDNPQVELTRQILKNFRYKSLSISVDQKGKGLELLLAVEGNNPDMYNGRPVQLNVRLAGDVLDFLKQNVMLQTSPETLINQGTP